MSRNVWYYFPLLSKRRDVNSCAVVGPRSARSGQRQLEDAWQEKAIDEGMLDNIPMPRWRQVFLRHIADLSRDLRFRA